MLVRHVRPRGLREIPVIKVQFYTPLGTDLPTSAEVEMPAAPRLGDGVIFEEDGHEYSVRAVVWTPFEPDFDVYVSLR